MYGNGGVAAQAGGERSGRRDAMAMPPAAARSAEQTRDLLGAGGMSLTVRGGGG